MNSNRPALSREAAEEVVQKILDKAPRMYHLITFKEYRAFYQGSLLKSRQYEKFLVLCHANTRYHAGYMVCPYVSGHFCSPRRGLFAIYTKKGGTNRFGRHILEHSKTKDTSTHTQDLGSQCWEEISRAAAMAVILDLRPISFAENQEGIAQYTLSSL